MDRKEAKLNLRRANALHKLGWLGEYKYEELPITDQLYIDGMVEKEESLERAADLLLEAKMNLLGCMGEDE